MSALKCGVAIFVALVAAMAADKVDVRVVKYDRLASAVREMKGKVVVVDLWAHW